MKTPALLLGSAVLLTAVGCHHTAREHRALDKKLEAHSQALTTAVVDTLQLQPPTERDGFTDLALTLAREDQRIEGIPARPIEVGALVDSADPGSRREQAKLAERFGEIRELIDRERRASDRLIAAGERFEATTNARRARWAKWIGSSAVMIGAFAALLVFCPAALPIVGRVCAWAVAKVPSLASGFGVVSVRAFDAVVRGIEKSRGASGGHAQTGRTVQLHNLADGDSSRGFADQPSVLELNLSREMDADHKRLVRARKAALNL